MVLKPEAVRSRLLKLEEVISRLEEIGPQKVERLSRSFRDQWTAERGLQLGAETILDIGNHVLSAHFGASAADHEAVIELLARHGVIEEELRRRLKGLGGFRNVLVHEYLRIDLDLVAEKLARAPLRFPRAAEEQMREMAACRELLEGAGRES